MPSKKNRLMTDQERLEFIEKWFLGSGEPRKPGPAIGLDQFISTNQAAEEPQDLLKGDLRLKREYEAAGRRCGKTYATFEHLTGMSLEEGLRRMDAYQPPKSRPWYRRLWEWLRDQLSAGE